MKVHYLILLAIILLPWQNFSGQNASSVSFNAGWTFSLDKNDTRIIDIDYDDTNWRKLDLPHDWSIESDFSNEYPSTAGGGALPGGLGWYRKSFFVSKKDANKCVYIDFDGVYCNSEVWINGVWLGKRPFGYIGFRYDLTRFIKFGDKNQLVVKVDNSKQPNSRWYSGSGIYRNVWLTIVNPVHVDRWGTFVTSTNVSEKQAKISVETRVVNSSQKSGSVSIKQFLLNADNKKVGAAESEFQLKPSSTETINLDLNINNPELWSIENPYQYKIKTLIYCNKKLTDVYYTSTGIRSFRFDPKEGFFLNGKHLKINGVCMHHDLGALGAVVNKRAIERQLQILKEMGVNGIRTSHNPPAPELLDLCDKMGFIVQDEAFDMWKKSKTTFDYSNDFAEWHERDLTDMLLRDRNHPSIFSWSIGNEVGEQWANTEAQDMDLQQANILLNAPKNTTENAESKAKINLNAMLTTHLVNLVKKFDITRPVTAACNETGSKNPLFVSGSLDLIGFNYHEKDFAAVPVRFPEKPFIVSESVSSLQTRGHYLMPSDSMHIWPVRWDIPFSNPIQKCSAYDNNHAPWGSTHETTLKLVKKMNHISGQYIWTGFDYIGEPTPYWWPSRSSYFGIVDLAGFPKDVYYMYQSEWTTENVLHVFPHWNWETGKIIDVWAYYNNADEVELFLNGKSLGVKSKIADDLHVMWRVKYEPGEIRVVSRKFGREVMEKVIKTAGKAVKIQLTPDRSLISADGQDLSFVTVELVDSNGTVLPNADNLVKFEVVGTAKIAGTDNGCQHDHNSLKKPERNLYFGKALCILQSTAQKGKVKLIAHVEGLPDAELIIKAN